MAKKVPSVGDPVGDMLTQIRNALAVKRERVSLPYARFKEKVALLLQEEGYLAGSHKDQRGNLAYLTLELKYHQNQPVIRGLKRMSKPGRRIYFSSKKIPYILAGYGIAVVSTSRGLLTDREARKRKLGGEVLFAVW